MRTKTMLIAVIVALAVAMVLTGSYTPAEIKDTAMDRRDKCLTHCNDAYGGLEWIRPRGGHGIFQGWANCILKCDRDYWDQFDKETETDS